MQSWKKFLNESIKAVLIPPAAHVNYQAGFQEFLNSLAHNGPFKAKIKKIISRVNSKIFRGFPLNLEYPKIHPMIIYHI